MSAIAERFIGMSCAEPRPMILFKHILVATDFEDSSARVVDVAVEMAKTLDAKLTLLHVWELPIYPYMDFVLTAESLALVQEAAVKRLESALEAVRKSFPAAESLLKGGGPWDGILEAVAETGADLVVMGTHGRRGVRHLLLGSVAEKVVRLCPVPVLTVRPQAST